MTLEFSRQIFEKYSNVKFRGNHPGRTELFYVGEETDGRTDRHGEANSRFSQFREGA